MRSIAGHDQHNGDRDTPADDGTPRLHQMLSLDRMGSGFAIRAQMGSGGMRVPSVENTTRLGLADRLYLRFLLWALDVLEPDWPKRSLNADKLRILAQGGKVSL